MDYHFFYTSTDPFSQWHYASFKEGELAFKTAEHYMMYHKAKLFRDKDAMADILTTPNPAAAKKVGRLVHGFEKDKWEDECLSIIYRGNKLKFNQNPKFKELLLATEGKLLVECSPTDKIYGCGFGMDDARRWNEAKWTGTNWLGQVLTELRDDFINGVDKDCFTQDFY